MRRVFTILVLLTLCGCAGSDPAGRLSWREPVLKPVAGVLPLTLSAEPAGDTWWVTLSSPAACDLYQLAGTVAFDPARYQLLNAASGGGLGDESATYFAWGEHTPGEVDFAYTERFYGAGQDGAVDLLVLELRSDDGLDLTDFTLPVTPDSLVARDSRKQPLDIRLVGVQQ